MTALSEYERLESGGLWRADADAQRREVTVSFGNATLVVADMADRPLTHWSLPAVTRQNPGARPAIFSPDVDGLETLEIDDDLMIDAIEKVRVSLAKGRAQPGKLRQVATIATVAGALALAVFWLPDALTRQTMSVMPQTKRAEIGAGVLGHVQRLTGPRCRNAAAEAVLDKLFTRLLGRDASGQIVVLPTLRKQATTFPGGIIAIDHGVIKAADDPAVVAGYILAAASDRQLSDPMEAVLQSVGLRVTLGLLTTGEISQDSLTAYARTAVEAAPERPDQNRLVQAFEAAQIPTQPYAFAVDPMGAQTRIMIANDPHAERDEPEILSDADWIRLQGICDS